MVYRKRRTRRARTSVKKVVEAVLSKRVEVKRDTIVFNNTLALVPFAYNPFDRIQLGDDNNERDGQKIRCKRISIRSNLVGADSPHNRIRLTIVETRKQLPTGAGASYNGTSIYDPTLTALGVNVPLDFSVVKRVILDRVVNLQMNQDGVGLSGRNVLKTFNKNFKYDKNIYYDDSNSGVQGNTTTHLYFCFWSDSGVLPHPSLNWGLTTYYTDM